MDRDQIKQQGSNPPQEPQPKKSQPWKDFFQVSKDTAENDTVTSNNGEIRLLPQRDDKDLGG
ncbi:hypothetical protein F5Y08DRAFT_324651 [Xylaria arbuscula]|nr:hypothetical protein F5Y08DRAFT_324651 [Xylaria arbuscula]